ncbi:hypothetical protein NMY22_g6594 [Coprinellus aureogranulatus]|nr:hypothetical protein NMY22_g6594 [Coprinellus aureogranulatus]
MANQWNYGPYSAPINPYWNQFGGPAGYPAQQQQQMQWGPGAGGAYADPYQGRPPGTFPLHPARSNSDSQSVVTSQISKKYPSLNAILAADTTLLRFDIKRRPRSEILTSTYYTSRHVPAKSTPTYHLRLISKAFPWSIDIQSAAHVNVTCEMVWDALYSGLQEPIVDSEWGFLIKDKKKMEELEKTVKKRLEAEPGSDKRPKRIDYLGDVTCFKGLERDEEYEQLRHLPHSAPVPDTWLVKLTS